MFSFYIFRTTIIMFFCVNHFYNIYIYKKRAARDADCRGPRTQSRYSAHGRSSGESPSALRRVKRTVWVLRDRSRLPREVAGNRLGDPRLTQAVCKRAAHGEGEGHAGEGGEDGCGPRSLLQEGGRHRAAGSAGEGAQERQRSCT